MQSHEPFFDYEIQKEPGKSTRVLAHPDQEVTSAEAIKIISGLLQEKVQVWPKPDTNLTRGEAAQLIYQQNDMNNRVKSLY